MMHTIKLYGHLRKTFGREFRFDVETAGEAMRALNCAFPKRFLAEVRKGSYRVVRGDVNEGMSIELAYINEFRLGNAELHLIPVASGSKDSRSAGTLKTVAGVALIGAAVFFSGGTLAAPLAGMTDAVTVGGTSLGITYGNIALVGLGLALSGAATLLSKATPTVDGTGSYAFTGPINVNQQGAAVPLIFGEVMCGSQAVSAGFDIVDFGSNQSTPWIAAQNSGK